MNCPVDDTQLQMSDRSGVEIDYCPRCRGVWLDRGELDKIIERSSGGPAPASQPYKDDRAAYSSHKRDDDDDDRHHDRSHHDSHGGQQYQNKRKKESFLGDLFDF